MLTCCQIDIKVAAQRVKMQLTLTTSPSHSTLTLDQPVLALIVSHQTWPLEYLCLIDMSNIQICVISNIQICVIGCVRGCLAWPRIELRTSHGSTKVFHTCHGGKHHWPLSFISGSVALTVAESHRISIKESWLGILSFAVLNAFDGILYDVGAVQVEHLDLTLEWFCLSHSDVYYLIQIKLGMMINAFEICIWILVWMFLT